MCTLVLLFRPEHDWPLVIAANRDERLDRPADPPGQWWPGIVGGRDRTGGGTWLALRPDGMVAAVLNRADSLGPALGFSSRGALPVLALRARDAAAAAVQPAGRYRPFNMIVADRAGAWFVRDGEGVANAELRLTPGLHMVTARDPDDVSSARIARHLPRLRAATAPAPPDWAGWEAIFADRSGPVESQINVAPVDGFGTVSASRIAVPRRGVPMFEHANGAPDHVAFAEVAFV